MNWKEQPLCLERLKFEPWNGLKMVVDRLKQQLGSGLEATTGRYVGQDLNPEGDIQAEIKEINSMVRGATGSMNGGVK